jgi:hypothetical protein
MAAQVQSQSQYQAYDNMPSAQDIATERLLEALEEIAAENRSRAGIMWSLNENGEYWPDAMDAVYAGADLGDNRVIELVQQMYMEASEPQGAPDESPLLATFIDEMGVDEYALLNGLEERLQDNMARITRAT